MGETGRTATSEPVGFVRSLTALAATRAFQQAAIFVAAASIAGGLIMWLLLSRASDLVSAQVIETMMVEVDDIAEIAEAAGTAAIVTSVARRSKDATTRLYLLVSSQGTKLAGNLERWPDELPVQASRSLTPRNTGGVFEYRTDAEAGRPRIAAGVARLVSGDARLLVGRDLAVQREFAAQVRWLYLAGFGALALAGLVAGLVASRLAVRRIAEIADTSDRIMAGEFSRRVPVTGAGDELDRLAGNLNAMLDRIENLMAGLREVSDNIAHDLKTPLTRLRTRAEEAMRDGDLAKARDGLGRVIEDADELIKTFNALLLIARLEAGALEGSAETFELAELVRDVAELYEPVAEEAGMSLVCRADEAALVHANRQLVGQAIANLIDNAIKYGPRSGNGGPLVGADITVGLALTEREVAISVADRGPGIPAGDRDRVLKRFVRLEASRTRPGTGLGLSLVAAVARLHGGRILLEDNAPGLRIVLALPRKHAAAGAAQDSSTRDT
jgi:signal transduction histidine kinase